MVKSFYPSVSGCWFFRVWVNISMSRSRKLKRRGGWRRVTTSMPGYLRMNDASVKAKCGLWVTLMSQPLDIRHFRLPLTLSTDANDSTQIVFGKFRKNISQFLYQKFDICVSKWAFISYFFVESLVCTPLKMWGGCLAKLVWLSRREKTFTTAQPPLVQRALVCLIGKLLIIDAV